MSNTRKTITNRKRFEIFKKDGFTCQYCGARGGADVELHIDHIEPFSKGGQCEDGNFITACQKCNSGKANIQVIHTEKPKPVKPKKPNRKDELIKDLSEQLEWFLHFADGGCVSPERFTFAVDTLEKANKRPMKHEFSGFNLEGFCG